MTEVAASPLTPLALEQAPLLRRLAEIEATPEAPVTKAELAAEFAKDPSNLNKIFARLSGEGLVASDSRPATLPTLTDQGRAALSALDRAEGRAVEGGVGIVHAFIDPDPDNRKDDGEGAEEDRAGLAESIARDGLLLPLLVRPADPDGRYMLIAGERRWRAIGALIEAGRWPADQPIPAVIREGEPRDYARLQIIENLQRKNLHPLDEALGFQRLVQDHGVRTADIAAEIGCTQRMVQQRLQLLELSPKDQDRLRDGKINLEQARGIVANKPKALELPAGQWLIVLEVFDRLQRAPKAEDGKTATQVDCLPATEEEAAELERFARWPNYLISGPWAKQDQGFDTGEFYVSASYNMERQLQLRFGDHYDEAAARAAMLAALRREAFPDQPPATGELPEGVYSTRWLNGAAERDPEIDARIAAAREARQQQQAHNEAVLNERDRRWEVALGTAEAIRATTAETPPAPLTPHYAATVADLGHQLPLSVDHMGNLVNADGSRFIEFNTWQTPSPGLMAKAWLIAVGINAAAGLATPEAPPASEEDEDDESEFVETTCRVCGCTDDDACEGGCEWVEDDLCSACVGKETNDGEAEAAPHQEALAERAHAGSRALYQDDFAAQVRAVSGAD